MKRYFSSLLLTALTVILVVLGILSVTVWKPAQDVTATGTTESPYLITRPGLFGLYGDGEIVKLQVTASSPEEHLWVALGSPADVSAWVESHSHDEVYGLSDIKTLKMESRQVDQEAAQSDDADSQDQEEAQSGEELVSPIQSDMWAVERDGVGTLEMVISESQMDLSLLAATNGIDPAPSLTLSWDTPKQNYAAIFLFSFAALFALLSIFSWVSTARRVRRRAATRRRLRAQITADTTETGMIPAMTPPAPPAPLAEEPTLPEVAEVESEPSADVVFAPLAEDETAVEESVEPAPELPVEEELVAEEVSDVPVAEEAAEEPETPKGDAFLDRSQQLTTESGLINLAALQGGGKFPTRRALREAQARGVGTLVIEGREFATAADPTRSQTEESPEAQQTAAVLGRRSLRRVASSETDGEVKDDA